MSAIWHLWCDLETTGLEWSMGCVLDAAFFLTDDELNRVGDPIDVLVGPPDGGRVYDNANAYDGLSIYGRFGFGWSFEFGHPTDRAAALHRESGLTDAWAAARQAEVLVPPLKVGAAVRALLAGYVGDGDTVRLAGSGVERFDRHWMSQLGLRFDGDPFHYRCTDISPARSFLREVCKLEFPQVKSAVPHRALADVEASLLEALVMRDAIRDRRWGSGD